MASLGFAQWATGVRNRMANDPGRADCKDQVQCHGHLFLHEYLDDVLNAPRPDNVIEFAKTPGRNKTASKRTRAANASAQKVKPIMPLSFPDEPVDKENISAPVPAPPAKQAQSKGTSRFQNALFTARETPADDAPHTRDSISRATFSRPGVPVFSPAAPTPARAPLDDPLSPFRDAELPEKAPPPVQQPQEKVITPQQLFTAKLVIQPSSPVAEPVEEPSSAVPPGLALTSALSTNTLAVPEPQPAEADLSIIQEDDEGNSIAAFEDARSEFSRLASRPTTDDEEDEMDITEIAEQPDEPPAPAAPAIQQEIAVSRPVKAASSPTAKVASAYVAPKAVSSPIQRPLTPVQRLPSPPASEDTPALSSKPGSPKVSNSMPEPVVDTAELEAAPVPASEPEPTLVAAPVPAPISTTSQPTPPPEPTPAAGPAPAIVARSESQQTQPAQVQPQPAQARPANPPRGLGGAFTGPSLKDLRREPSVSGAVHRELRQSSWRKKPDGAVPTSAPVAPIDESNRLKRKSSVLTKPGTSKHQRKHSTSSSHSLSSSDSEPTEMQVPLKDEDSTGGSGWNSGGSMLDDLRSRLARLEKSTSGKTPAANRTWGVAGASGSGATPVLDPVGLPDNGGGDERRMSISDLGIPTKPVSLANKPQIPPTQGEDAATDPLSLSTDAQESQRAANESILSNRTTTPDNSPPPVRRVLPAPPVFAVPVEPPAPVAAKASSDAVRAAAKAEAAKLFAGTKLVPTRPASRMETQSTVMTETDSVLDTQSQAQSQWSQSTTQTQSIFGADAGDLADADLDDELDADADGEADEEAEEETQASNPSSLASSTTQTRSMVKKGPVKSIQLAAAAAKKAAEEQDRKMSRMKDMEERRQAAALRKAEEDKAKSSELEKKRKEREELAASKSVKPVAKKAQEDPNKKRKVEAEKKPTETKKPMGSTVFKDTAATKSRIAKPAAGPSTSTSQPPQLKSAMKSTTNPFAPPPSATKTIKHAGSSSSLKSISGSISKKAKASISDAPGQALQAQMHARVQAQMKAAQKEPEIQSESIELPDINSEYSDSDDEDRGKDFPGWTQSDELMQALKDQESYNPAAIFGPIQPLKMTDLFKTGHARFRKRTSSANWAGTDGITLEEEIEYARRMGYKN